MAKFDRFIEENNAKRRKAIAKSKAEQHTYETLCSEQAEADQRLATLRERLEGLQRAVETADVYRRYLQSVVDSTPVGRLGSDNDPLAGVMARSATLQSANEELRREAAHVAHQVCGGKRGLSGLEQSMLAGWGEDLEDAVLGSGPVQRMLCSWAPRSRRSSEKSPSWSANVWTIVWCVCLQAHCGAQDPTAESECRRWLTV